MFCSRSDVGSWRAWRLSIAALSLIAGCGDDASFEAVALTAVPVRAPLPAPVFAVEPTLMDVPTYDGSGEAVHPDVVAFDYEWNDARYWLTMTPYAKSDQTLENPSILSSADGRSVRVPAGLENPVIKPPVKSRDYNSDPELLYEPKSDRLVMFYRFVEKKTNTIHVSVTRDGVNWTALPAPFWERSHQAVSPTVAPRAGAPARMWYVNAGRAGCDTKSTRVVVRNATDQTGGIVDTRWLSPKPTDLAIPGYVIWHIKARWIPEKSEYWMLIAAFPEGTSCQTDDLFFARSSDGVHWTAYPQPVLRHEDRQWTAGAVYRSSFLYDPHSDELQLWISARGTDDAWRMGYARVRYSRMLSVLEANQPLAAAPSKQFVAPPMSAREQP